MKTTRLCHLLATTLIAVLTLAACNGETDRSAADPIAVVPPIVQGPPWFPIGPAASPVQSPVAINPATQAIYVGSLGGGVYRSDVKGTSTIATNTGLNTQAVGALAMAPSSPNVLYAGTFGGGVYKTVDGGGTWTVTAAPSAPALYLAVDPLDANVVYAAYNNAVPLVKSVDGGASWQPASSGLTATALFTLAIDRGNPRRLYAGSPGNGGFRSSDGGASWQAMSIASTVWALTVDPNDSAVIYAGTGGGGVYRSTDFGVTFARMGSPTVGVVLSILREGARLIAGTAGAGLFYSDDDGRTWIASDFREGLVLSLASAGNGVFLAGTSAQGVRISQDFGVTWTRHATTVELETCACQNGHALALDPLDARRVFLSTNDGGMFARQLTSGSVRFFPVYNGMTARSPRGITFNPRFPNRVYAGSFIGDGFFKSLDGGATWTRKLFGPATVHVTGIAVTPDGATLYVTLLNGGGLWSSVDDGETFTRIDVASAGAAFLNLGGRGIAVDPLGGPNVYHAGGNGVWRSTDRGATWTRQSTVAALTVTVHPLDTSIVLVGTNTSGVLKSSDSGATFAASNGGLADLRMGRTGGVQISPKRPEVFYVNTEGGGVFKSRDQGNTWAAVNTGLGDLTVYGLAIDPADPDVLYAATQKSVFMTTRGGE